MCLFREIIKNVLLINQMIHQPALFLRYNRSFSHQRKAEIIKFSTVREMYWYFYEGGGSGLGVVPTISLVVFAPPYLYHYNDEKAED